MAGARTLDSVQLWREFTDIDTETGVGSHGASVAIGVFDGVHKGHQKLLAHAVTDAKRHGTMAVMVTFDPHPVEVIMPGKSPETLTPLARRAELAAEYGIDAVFAIPFDKEIASWTPAEFFDRLLVERLHARSVVVGTNFTFGYKAAGTAETLKSLCEARGIECHIEELVSDGEGTVSSTAIRHALAEGDARRAGQMLGRPHRVTGEVIHGEGRGGKELGYPTANLSADMNECVPVDGVYAGWFTVLDGGDLEGSMKAGTRYPAAISVGTNPTFDDEARTVEAFVLDETSDLYGRHAAVDFVGHVRGMEKFNGIDELLEAMDRDVKIVRSMLDGCDETTGISREGQG